MTGFKEGFWFGLGFIAAQFAIIFLIFILIVVYISLRHGWAAYYRRIRAQMPRRPLDIYPPDSA